MLVARKVWDVGPATGRDQDVLGTVPLARHFHGMGIDQTCVGLQQGDAAVDQQVLVDAVEPLDLAVLVGDQGLPVERLVVYGPAETLRLFDVLGVMGAVHQQFLRHATDVDAGSAEVATLRHCHPRTVTGGETRGTHATRAGTDDEKIEVVSH